MLIPKIVHTTWINTDVLTSNHPMAVKGIQSLISLNPDWDVRLYPNEDIDTYLQTTMESSDYQLIRDFHVVQKSDIWRLFKLYYEGGMYIDIDRFVNKKLNDVISPHVKCVFCTCEDNDFSQDIMITAPGNPIFATAILLYITRIRLGIKNTYFLGPQTYMHAITGSIGQVYNTNPGKGTMNSVRAKLNELGFAQTFREQLPNNTFVYSGNETLNQWEQTKRTFYKEFNLKHWTGEW